LYCDESISMSGNQQCVRIFISSPGDVADERERARRLIQKLQHDYPDVQLLPVLWEDLLLTATESFQVGIEKRIPLASIDVAVFIIWSRLGTPLGPPMVRADGTPYSSGTEREFELMLDVFERNGNQRPVILAYVRDDDAGFWQRFVKEDKLVGPKESIAQKELAQAFVMERFHDAEGRNYRAYKRYTGPVEFSDRLRRDLREALTEILGADAPCRWLDAPYRSLEVFDVAHADIFFGRHEETLNVIQKLREQDRARCSFVVIVGASGSGKSSLARAGVAASLLQQEGDDGVKEWRAAFVLPGPNPNEFQTNLVRSLVEAVPELGPVSVVLPDIAAGFTQNAELTLRLSIGAALSRASEKAGGPVRILLVIDQMEELWTAHGSTTEIANTFFASLEAMARSGHVLVLGTLRSDFYADAQKSPAFLRLKGEHGHFDLLPPRDAALRQLIIEPAKLAGLKFERQLPAGRSLDEDLWTEAARDGSTLPLLQYAMSKLYDQRDPGRRLLTFAAYQEIGGIEGALGREANSLYANLSNAAQVALNEILPLLVSCKGDGQLSDVRLRAPLELLTATPARKQLTDLLTAARFLTISIQGDVPVAVLSHEALLRRWDHLVGWISKNRKHLRLRDSVEASRQEWERRHRDNSVLLPSGLLLEEGRQLLVDAPHLLLENSGAAEYIQSSINYRDGQVEEIRRQREIAERNKEEARRELELRKKTAAVMTLMRGVAVKGDGDWQDGVRLSAEAWQKYPDDDRRRRGMLRYLLDTASQSGQVHPIPIVTSSAIQSMTLNRDGSRLLTECPRGNIKFELWSTATGLRLAELDENSASAKFMFTPEGSTIVGFYSVGTATTIKEWDATNGRIRDREWAFDGQAEHLCFSPDGDCHYVIVRGENSFELVERISGRVLGGRPLKTGLPKFKVSPNDMLVCTVSSDGACSLWNLKTETIVDISGAGRRVQELQHAQFSPDSQRVAIIIEVPVNGTRLKPAESATSTTVAELWCLQEGVRLAQWKHSIEHSAGGPARVTDCQFDHEGRTVLSLGSDSILKRHDAQSGAPLEGISIPVSGAESENGNLFGWTSAPNAILIRDSNTATEIDLVKREVLNSRSLVGELPWHGGPFDDRTIRPFAANKWVVCTDQFGHEISRIAWFSRVYGQFSPDGGLFVRHDRGGVDLWQINSGDYATSEAVAQRLHGSSTRDPGYRDIIQFSPDGTQLVYASNNVARIADLSARPSLSDYHYNNTRIPVQGTTCVLEFAQDERRLIDLASMQTVVRRPQEQPINLCQTAGIGNGRVLSRDSEGRVFLVNSETLEIIAQAGMARPHDGYEPQFSADGSVFHCLAAESSWDTPDEIGMWDSESGMSLLRYTIPLTEEDSGIHWSHVCFLAEGRSLLAWNEAGHMVLWDTVVTGKPLLSRVTSNETSRYEVQVSSDGQFLVLFEEVGESLQAARYSAVTGSPAGVPVLIPMSLELTWSNDCRLVFVMDPEDQQFDETWNNDFAGREAGETEDEEVTPYTLKFRVFDLLDGTSRHTAAIRVEYGITLAAAAFSPTADRIAAIVHHYSADQLCMFETTDLHALTRTLPESVAHPTLIFSTDGSVILTECTAGTYAWRAETLMPVDGDHRDAVEDGAFLELFPVNYRGKSLDPIVGLDSTGRMVELGNGLPVSWKTSFAPVNAMITDPQNPNSLFPNWAFPMPDTPELQQWLVDLIGKVPLANEQQFFGIATELAEEQMKVLSHRHQIYNAIQNSPAGQTWSQQVEHSFTARSWYRSRSLAMARLAECDWTAARFHLRSAITKNPTDCDSYSDVALVESYLQNYAAALHALDQVERLDSRKNGLLHRALLYLAAGDEERCRKQLADADAETSNADPVLNLRSCLDGDPAAVAKIRAAMTADPNGEHVNPIAWLNELARARHYMQGCLASAELQNWELAGEYLAQARDLVALALNKSPMLRIRRFDDWQYEIQTSYLIQLGEKRIANRDH
jgi:WD40 repeat protein